MTSPIGAIAAPERARCRAGRRTWWVCLIGLCAVLLAPLLIVDVPPLLDYPNHLARVFVLASLPDDQVLARFYAARWSVIPNLGLDLVAPPLIRVLPVHVVGRMLIGAALLLPVLGTVAYGAALRRGGGWWLLGVGLVAYNSCLLAGFLNFEIGLGVALLVAAGWLRWREDHPARTIVLAVLGALVLFACHLMGLVFFGLLIGGAELFRLSLEQTVAGVVREGLRRGAVLVLVFAAPGALYVLSALRSLGGDAGFLPAGAKLLQLATTFVNYDWRLDMVTAGAAFAVPAACLLSRRGLVPGPAAVSAVLLLAAFLAAPFAWKGTYALDTRFATMLGFMLFAGFVPAGWRRWQRGAVGAALVLLFAARMALLMTAWAAHRADLADLRTVLATVRPGQAVYVAEAGIQEAPSYWEANPRWRLLSNGARMDEHLGALTLIEHRAYWPFEFDSASQQPIETREPYRGLAAEVGYLRNRGQTEVADLCGFDFVLLMAADSVPELPPDRFRLVVQSGYAALYDVTKCEGVPGGG